MSMADADALVSVEGLAKRFGARTVVSDLSLTVMPGEMIALIGANGGGKTTTLRMIAGLLKPDAGTGRVLGCDMGRQTRTAQSKMGYMTQRHALYPELTVAENLSFRSAVQGLARSDDAVARTIETYQLVPYLETRFEQLSGGWARRVQLAATMLHMPQLLLLDEPTAGLDALSRAEIWARLRTYAAQGRGVIISTHDLPEAQHCTGVIDYDQGPGR